MSKKVQLAHVILPVPIDKPLYYTIPDNWLSMLKIGHSVIVPLGKKIYVGIVYSIGHISQNRFKIKPILGVFSSFPLMNTLQLVFLKWVAQYYMTPLGEVVKAAFPIHIKSCTDFYVKKNPAYQKVLPEEKPLIDILDKCEAMPYQEWMQNMAMHNSTILEFSMFIQQKIRITHSLQKYFFPSTCKVVYLAESYTKDDKKLQETYAQLEKYPKQLDVLLQYIQIVSLEFICDTKKNAVEKKVLVEKGVSKGSLQTLIKKKIFVEKEILADIPSTTFHLPKAMVLTPPQQKAYIEISKQYNTEKKNIVLLHGITGSGKTAIYIQLIYDTLKKKKQVLYLLPEIALTTQLVERLQKYFGPMLGVYHSRHTDKEKIQTWQGLHKGRYNVIVGVRSAIFLPFNKLGLVIVDEEHETSYKQQQKSPRYHARDSSTMLAKYHKAKVLLGSATPSIESFYYSQNKKYGYVALKKRYGNASLPHIYLQNIHVYKNHIQNFILSPELNVAIEKTLAAKQQVIIFQNRRGYAPYYHCAVCSWTAKCIQCAVYLTYHQQKSMLCCHYCGYQIHPMHKCTACNATTLYFNHFGTEKIESLLKEKWPKAHIARMDLDTTRKKKMFENIIKTFSRKDTDILVGTQMVTKGFDFSHVALVGVLDIDRFLHFPDFRAYEHCFQRIVQVSGRAGRAGHSGKVIIQTVNPQHDVLQYIKHHNYIGLYKKEIIARQKYIYPPFVRLIKISIQHIQQSIAQIEAEKLYTILAQQWGKMVLGPQKSVIAKLKNNYSMEITIKYKKSKGNNNTKIKIQQILQQRSIMNKQIKFIVDVDPV